MKKVEGFFESFLFASRWLIAPVYLALVVSLVVLLFKAVKQAWILATNLFSLSDSEIIMGVLSIVDISLIMNLLVIIIFSGYENFVSKMDHLHGHDDRPDWMGSIGFSDLKLKLIGSIVAVSGVELLKTFMSVDQYSDRHMAWMIGIHITFVVSGLIYALMDRLGHSTHPAAHQHDAHSADHH